MKRINYNIIKFTSILLLAGLVACAPNSKEDHAHAHDEESELHEDDHGNESGEHDEHEEEGIRLNKDQMEKIGLQFGELAEIKINDYVTATGTLGLPPNAYSSVSAKAEGFIRGSQKYVEGSYIKKGVLMASVENPEFILRQQEYLQVKAELKYLEQELSRQKQLIAAEAGVERSLQKLEAEVSSKDAQFKGIAKYLSYLGIGVSELTADNIQQSIAIIAPISGYLTSINMHNGMFVEPQMELMEIVDEGHLHLELDVFEKDISKIDEGQKISYSVPAIGSTIYEGEVHIIGKEFNESNKTVRIHGHLEQERPMFIKGLFISAKIWLNDQTVTALPEDAVIKDGTKSYIFVGKPDSDASEITFEQITVIPGPSDNGFISVKLLDEIPEGMKVVTEAAYYVYAQSKAGELEHEH